jgi:DNA-binding transcriptional LysR family regulator
MDRIDLYRTFMRVVDCASFTRAAEILDLPRSTVSAAIQELEARVGARLLHRTTRRVAPTHDGIAFYSRCQRIIEDVEDSESLFRHSAEGMSGRIRVDVPARIGRLIVAPALPDFLRSHPKLHVELGATDRSVRLVEENVDCALRVGELEDSSMIARHLGELRLINVASPAYLKRRGTPTAPADLEHHHAVLYASPTSGRVADWEWMEGTTLRTMQVPGRITVNNAESYIACCLAGVGLIQIPAYDVRDQLASGDLIEVLPGHRAAPMPVTILYPHRRHLSRRLRIFMDWLAEQMAEPLAA